MRQSKSAKQYEDIGIDPFSAPPAGYSLTQPEGKWPWEASPTYVTVDEAYEAILSRIKVPEERMDLLNLMDAGIPIETLVRTITFTAFSKGLMTPDVAEMVNVPLSVYLLVEAQKAGITPRFNNTTRRESIPYDDILNIMSELNPDRYMEYMYGEEELPPNDKKEETENKNLLEADKMSFLKATSKENKDA